MGVTNHLLTGMILHVCCLQELLLALCKHCPIIAEQPRIQAFHRECGSTTVWWCRRVVVVWVNACQYLLPRYESTLSPVWATCICTNETNGYWSTTSGNSQNDHLEPQTFPASHPQIFYSFLQRSNLCHFFQDPWDVSVDRKKQSERRILFRLASRPGMQQDAQEAGTDGIWEKLDAHQKWSCTCCFFYPPISRVHLNHFFQGDHVQKLLRTL